MTARELYDFLGNYTEYPGVDDYTDIYNAVIDYSNETGDYQFDYLFEDFIDEEIILMQIERYVEEKDLVRIYYFLGNANLAYNDIWRIDGYGNLEDADSTDIRYLVEEIRSGLEDIIGEEDIEGEE